MQTSISNDLKSSIKSNPIMASLLGAAGVGYLAYLGFNQLKGGSGDTYLSASGLGKRGRDIEQNMEGVLFGDNIGDIDPELKVTLSTGRYFHTLMEDIFGITGAESEVRLVDKQLGIAGSLDVLLPGNIPVEVKTVSPMGFESLGRPREPHVSQLNFYLHARQAKYGYLLYLNSQDISKNKVYRVGYQPGRLVADVEAARQAMMTHPEQMGQRSIQWLTQVYKSDPAYFRGVRHSSGSAGSWPSIRPSPEFPGGRIASIRQAAVYRNLSNTGGHIPTMGLTIRRHETAIGHRSRSSAKKAGAEHCNGSRAYRC